LNLLLLIFIITPIIEIGVFIQVGDIIGLGPTLLMVFITAIIGVNLLKSQGLSVWQEIQNQLAQGQVPALAMASAAQLLFAGGLLLTPGFVTDTVGFLLLVPAVRLLIAKQMMKRWTIKSGFQQSSYHSQSHVYSNSPNDTSNNFGRTIEGDFEEKSKEEDK